MQRYSLQNDGDFIEKKCCTLFLNTEFPSYEKFWITNIVPLTRRPRDIHFKTNQELQQIGKTEHDICIAQLHYSILNHLSRAYEIKSAISIAGFNLEVHHPDARLPQGLESQDISVACCSANVELF